MKIFTKSKVALGKGHVTQYILFEHKSLFSIIFYKWNTIDQIRFHTHAFNSFAFLLHGWYWEKVKFGDITTTNLVNQPLWPRWIPKNYCHAIEVARPGSISMVICGPWDKHWYEYFPYDSESDRDGFWQKYGWGRVKVSTHDNHYDN